MRSRRTLALVGILTSLALAQQPAASMPSPDSCDFPRLLDDLTRIDLEMQAGGRLQAVEAQLLELYPLTTPEALRAWHRELETLAVAVRNIEVHEPPACWLLAVYLEALSAMRAAVEELAACIECGESSEAAWDHVAVVGQRFGRFSQGYLQLLDVAILRETQPPD